MSPISKRKQPDSLRTISTNPPLAPPGINAAPALTPGATLGIRVLAVSDLVAGATIVGWLIHDLARYGLVYEGAGGNLAAAMTAITFVVAPALLLGFTGVGLWRLERAAWVLQVAIGCLLIPLFGVGAAILFMLLPRAARWQFGIGSDAVLAEIEARQATTVAEMAQRFGVPDQAIRLLLEQVISQGSFAGGVDRLNARVYSPDAMALRADLQRCPPCGSAIEAEGALISCPYCGTEFARNSGFHSRPPFPTGLSVLSTLDRLLAYGLGFTALLWVLIYQGLDWSGMSPLDIAWGYVLLALLPVSGALLYLAVARGVEARRRWAWWAQGLLLPPALPYLLSRKVKYLFAFGLKALKDRLQAKGELPFAFLADALHISPAHSPDAAVFLVASRHVQGVIDWSQRRIVGREWLKTHGDAHCQHCGAPRSLLGTCGYCGTGVNIPHKENPAEVEWNLPSAPAIFDRKTLYVLVGAYGVASSIGALVAMRSPGPEIEGATSYMPSPTDSVDMPWEAGTLLPRPHEQPMAKELIPVTHYSPTRAETFLSPTVSALSFSPDGKSVISGEAGGIFLWDVGSARPVKRTPESWEYAGVSRIRFGTRGDLLLRPYYESILLGSIPPLQLGRRLDLEPLEKRLAGATVGDATGLEEGGWRLAFTRDKTITIVDTDGWRVRERLEIEAGMTQHCLLSEGGRYLAILPGEGSIKLHVWDLEQQKKLLIWEDEGVGIFALSLEAMAFLPGGRWLAVSSFRALTILDIQNGAKVKVLEVDKLYEPLVIASDASCLAASGLYEGELEAKDFRFKVVALDDGHTVANVSGHRGWIRALAISPNGKLIASGDTEGRVRFLPLGEPCGDGKPNWLRELEEGSK